MNNLIFAKTEIQNRSVIINADDTMSVRVVGTFEITGNRSLVTVPEQDLSIAPLEYITALTNDFKLKSIVVAFSEDVVENVELWVDNTGVTRDVNIYSELTSNDDGVTGENCFAFYPDSEIIFMGSEAQQLKINITNNGGIGIAYVQIVVEVLS